MSLKILLKYLYIEGFISDKINKLAQDTEYDPQELLDKFNKYRQQYKLDINQFNTIEDLATKLDEIESGAVKTKTQYKKTKGISGLTSGVDYIEIPMDENYIQAYIPLNWSASKVIASAKIGGTEGKWCTAYQKDISYWNQYIHKDNNILVYVLVDEWEHKEPETPETVIKYAIQVHDEGLVTVWDEEDRRLSSYPSGVPVQKIHNYVNQNWDIIKDKIPPYYKFLIEINGIAINQVIDSPLEYTFYPGDGGNYIFNFDPKITSDSFFVSFEGDYDEVNMQAFMNDFPEIFQYFWDKHLAHYIDEELYNQDAYEEPAVRTAEFNAEDKSLTVHYTQEKLLDLLEDHGKIESSVADIITNPDFLFDLFMDVPPIDGESAVNILSEKNKKMIKKITGIDIDEEYNFLNDEFRDQYEDIYYIIQDGYINGLETFLYNQIYQKVREYLNDLGFEASDKSDFTWMHTVFAEDYLHIFLGILSEKYWYTPFSDYTDFNDNESLWPFLSQESMSVDFDSLGNGFDDDACNEFIEDRLKEFKAS